MLKILKPGAIKALQSVYGPYPDKTSFILSYCIDFSGKKSRIRSVMGKIKFFDGLRRYSQAKPVKDQQEPQENVFLQCSEFSSQI